MGLNKLNNIVIVDAIKQILKGKDLKESLLDSIQVGIQ